MAPNSRPRFGSRATQASLAMAILLAGCTTPRFTFDDAPAADPGASGRVSAVGARNVVAIAPFQDRSANPIGWSDLGDAMTDVVVRSLRNDARVDVRIYEGPLPADPITRAEMVRAAFPDADYLVMGEVTDFNHTDEVAEGSLRRLGIFGRRREAFSSINLEVLRLDRFGVALQDHVYGTAEVPRGVDMPGAYENIGPRSYLFWSTPLGQATREALDETIERIETLPPLSRETRLADGAGDTTPAVALSTATTPRILKSISSREVVVDAGRSSGLRVGERLTIRSPDGSVVVDPVLGRPIEAVLLTVEADRATAYLSGDLGGRSPAGLLLARDPVSARAGVSTDR
ncbi:MAG: hypothetical protein ACO3QA_04100 [Phycisphaerales bacterium]